MTCCFSTIPLVSPFIASGKTSRGVSSINYELPRYVSCLRLSHRLLIKLPPTGNRPASKHIHILDDDSLLNIFSFCRPLTLDESEAPNIGIIEEGKWNRGLWWYILAHVCHRWRYVVLESPSYLQLSLLCTHRTPVADMLANSPSFPLVIDHLVDTGDAEGIILALQHRDRVRRIRLRNIVPELQKLILALDGEYPILEYMVIQHQSYFTHRSTIETSLNLPETFRAPHLRQLVMTDFDIPIGSPLLPIMGNLVTLYLDLISPSTHSHPNALLQRISLMPHLKTLGIFSRSHFSSGDITRHLWRVPITTHVTLPNLRWFGFKGSSAYLEALLPWISFPLLENLHVYFFDEAIYSIPRLQQYMGTAGNFCPISITLIFNVHHLDLMAHFPKGCLSLSFCECHLERQVASAARFLYTLGTVLSAVERLTLRYERHFAPSTWNNEAHRTWWRKLLRLFSKVKAILVDGELVEQLSDSLQPGEGESLMELLPELRELSYYSTDAPDDPFAPFIDARLKAGHPVT